MKKVLLSLGVMAMALSSYAEGEQTLAFPGAEGYGRYVTGGRGGNVYHVTSLEDDNSEGTLRWANSQPGPRTIVFDVSGTIQLTKALGIATNTTLAGQTAPGDGICIAGYPVTLNTNNIIRFIRFRVGNEHVDKHEGDGLGAMDKRNIIVDHCSVSWSVDECLSVYGSRDITVQWCISNHSMVNSGHSKGAHGYGGNWGGSGASYHHNLMSNHTSRTPRFGPRPGTQKDERMDYRNNVIYNWGGNGCYGGEGMNVNVVNNYYKPGPGTPSGSKGKRIAGIGVRTIDYCLDKATTIYNFNRANGTSYKANQVSVVVTSDGTPYLSIAGKRVPIDVEAGTLNNDGVISNVGWNNWGPMVHKWGTFFIEGNVNTKYEDVTADNWGPGFYDQIDKNGNDKTFPGKNDCVKNAMKRRYPVEFVYTTTHDAATAYERVLDYVGCSLVRDQYDAILIQDVRDGEATWTGKGLGKGFVNSQNDITYSDGTTGWPALASADAKVDTDGDGMPDEWETANGLNPDDPEDRNVANAEGYTNLELYINSLVQHIMDGGNAGGTVMNGFDGAPAGVDEIITDTNRPEDNRVFNLMGVEVNPENLAPGIYIKNGKKFLVR